MTDYVDWIILKTDLPEKQDEYTTVAEWCNESGQYTIEDDGIYYKVVAIPVPTEDELKVQIRSVRDAYLQHYDFTQLPDAPFTEEEKIQYVNYRQYLRDYTLLDNWWLSNPKTFEEWLNNNN
jgi:hypothetical protein